MPAYARPKPLRLPTSHLQLAGELRGPWRTTGHANAFDDAFVAPTASSPLLVSPPPLTSGLTALMADFTFPACTSPEGCASPRSRCPPTHRRHRSTLSSPRGTGRRPSLPLTPIVARRPTLVTSSGQAAQQRRQAQRERNLLIAAEDPKAVAGLQLVDSYLGIAGKERYKAERCGYGVLAMDKKRWKREPEAVRLLGPGQRSSVYMLRKHSLEPLSPRRPSSPRTATRAPRRRKARPPPLDLGTLSSFSSSSSTTSIASLPSPRKRVKPVPRPAIHDDAMEVLGADPIATEVARRKKVAKKPSLAALVVRRIKSLHKLG